MKLKTLISKGSESGHQKAYFAYCRHAAARGWAYADAWANEAFCTEVQLGVSELMWVHAIPNGGSRGDDEQTRMIRGANLKAEGVRDGVADVFLPVPRQGFAGLYIEFKKPSIKPKNPMRIEKGAIVDPKASKGGLSDEQTAFALFVTANFYKWVVVYSWDEAVNVTKEYLK